MTAENETADAMCQANEIALIVIEQMSKVRPDVFVTLRLRYGIADALWAAGYRKTTPGEVL